MPLAQKHIERFWKYTLKGGADDCWIWISAKDKDGYGLLWVDTKNERAHRISWEIANGPTDLHVLHTCDTPACVNPKHLFIGTNADNMKDRNNKGRQARNADFGHGKLLPEDVREIRRRYIPGVVRQVDLAYEFNVTRATIYHIISGQSYRWVN